MSKLKKIFILVIIIVFSLMITGCNNKLVFKNADVSITLDNIPDYDFHSKIENNFLKDLYSHYDEYGTGKKLKAIYNPLKISFNVKNKNNLNLSYLLKIYDSSNHLFNTYKTNKNYFEVYNLYLNESYTYTLDIYSDNKLIGTIDSSFKVKTTMVRTIYLENVKNIRDLGGYKTVDGKEIKQGLIYRSERLNESNSDTFISRLSENDVNILKFLNIKTEMDLRNGEYERGYISETSYNFLDYYNFPFTYEGNILLSNKENIIKCFDILSNEDNYPIIYHCSAGCDRTGLISFLLLSILGAKIEDIYHDYLYSNLYNVDGERTLTAIDNYLKVIGTYKDETLQKKTIDYLISIGIENEKIANIQRILLK